MFHNIIFLKPFLSERPWGGAHLKNFNINLPNNKIGEAWIISGMKDKSSIIISEEHQRISLREFFENHKMFFDNYEGSEYPLLVKLLDCNQDLSIQVHPTDQYADQHRDAIAKNEAWYILEAKPNSSIVYGHHAKTKDELIKLIDENNWSKLLNIVPVKYQDLFYVPSGTLHALKSGLIIFEIQQASDCTYRLYDYGREKQDPTRKLHTQEAIENITVPFVEPVLQNKNGELLTTPYFSIKLINNVNTNSYAFDSARWLQCFVIGGKGTINGINITKGSTFIIGNGDYKFELSGKLGIIITYIVKS